MRLLFTYLLLFVFSTLFYPQSSKTYFVDAHTGALNRDGSLLHPWKDFNDFDINTLPESNITIKVAPGIYKSGHPDYNNGYGNALLYIQKKSNITIIYDGLDIENGALGQAVFDGGYNISLQFCVNNPAIVYNSSDFYKWGIRIDPIDGIGPIANINIIGITFRNFREASIKIIGRTNSLCSNIIIENCSFEPVVGTRNVSTSICTPVDSDYVLDCPAIDINTASGITIKNCNINGVYAGGRASQTDGIYFDNVNGVTIENTTVNLKNDYQLNDQPHIDCVQFFNCSNINIYNSSFSNTSIIDEGNLHPYYNRQCLYANNVSGVVNIHNNICYSIKGDNTLNFTLTSEATSFKMYNNNFIADNSQGTNVRVRCVVSNILHIKNNIFYKKNSSRSGEMLKMDNTNISDPKDITNNLFYISEIQNYNPKITYKDGFDFNILNEDPKFEDTEFLRLEYNSPAKNSGLTIYSDVNTDFLSNTRPSWSTNCFDKGAYEIPDAQIKFGSNTQGTKIFFNSLGAKWTKNGEDFSITSNYSSSNTYTATDDKDNWRGWNFPWVHYPEDDTNKIAAHGFYKVSHLNGQYFYLDLRDRISNYSPNIYLEFNLDHFESIINDIGYPIDNGEIKRIWELNSGTANNFNDFWQNALLLIPDNNNHPRLIWGPYNKDGKTANKYKIYKSKGDGAFQLLQEVQSQVLEYIDLAETIVSGAYIANETIAKYYIIAQFLDLSLSGTTNQVQSRIEGENLEKMSSSDSKIDFQLSQNYPNPFNPTTTISFSIPNSSLVEIVIYNSLGQHLGTILKQYKEQGNYSVTWDGTVYPSGVYFYELKTESRREIKKMLLIK